jgi:hypothetical protein
MECDTKVHVTHHVHVTKGLDVTVAVQSFCCSLDCVHSQSSGTWHGNQFTSPDKLPHCVQLRLQYSTNQLMSLAALAGYC